jgi:hypothetical protein
MVIMITVMNKKLTNVIYSNRIHGMNCKSTYLDIILKNPDAIAKLKDALKAE